MLESAQHRFVRSRQSRLSSDARSNAFDATTQTPGRSSSRAAWSAATPARTAISIWTFW